MTLPDPDWQSDDGSVRLYCADCIDILPLIPDKSIDAVVTDPPYGIGEARNDNASRTNLAAARDYGIEAWDDTPPDPQFFDHMRRCSRHQVVFGGNHLASWLGSSPSWIVWDKDNGGNDFADCELAWTSHKKAVRKIVHRWNGMLTEPGVEKDQRTHPTQKPLRVMSWIVENYTESHDLICDPFMGSGTTGVACVRLGRQFIGVERERKYFDIAVRRIKEAFADGGLFNGCMSDNKPEPALWGQE